MTTKVYILQSKSHKRQDCWGYLEKFDSIKEARKALNSPYSTADHRYRIIKRTIKDEVVR